MGVRGLIGLPIARVVDMTLCQKDDRDGEETPFSRYGVQRN